MGIIFFHRYGLVCCGAWRDPDLEIAHVLGRHGLLPTYKDSG